MPKNDSEFQVKIMSRMFREKQIFKPLNIGYIDERECKNYCVKSIY